MRKSFLILSTIIMLALGAVAMKFIIVNNPEKQIPSPSPELSPVFNVPADWKTFTKEGRYTFKYPPEMDSDCCSIDGLNRGEERDIMLTLYPARERELRRGGADFPLAEGLVLGVHSQPNENNQSVEAYINRYKEEFDNPDREGYIDTSLCQENSVMVGNYPAVQLTNCSIWETNFILLKQPTKNLIVVISWDIKKNNELPYQTTLDQILLTFRFAEN